MDNRLKLVTVLFRWVDVRSPFFHIFAAYTYVNHAYQIFLSSAHSIRLAVPLGLNMCPPFHSIAKVERPPSILPPARTVIEDETRRNAFWLAYALERQNGCGNGWALSLDNQDVSQLLPVRGDQFLQGVSFPLLIILYPETHPRWYNIDPCTTSR